MRSRRRSSTCSRYGPPIPTPSQPHPNPNPDFGTQSLVSLRRIEKYLHGAEVAPVPPLGGAPVPVAFQGATVTWPQDRARGASASAASSAAPTPRNKFVLVDLNLAFPRDRLSLVCGKLGSGKTLLLLGECARRRCVEARVDRWLMGG